MDKGNPPRLKRITQGYTLKLIIIHPLRTEFYKRVPKKISLESIKDFEDIPDQLYGGGFSGIISFGHGGRLVITDEEVDARTPSEAIRNFIKGIGEYVNLHNFKIDEISISRNSD